MQSQVGAKPVNDPRLRRHDRTIWEELLGRKRAQTCRKKAKDNTTLIDDSTKQLNKMSKAFLMKNSVATQNQYVRADRIGRKSNSHEREESVFLECKY